MLKTYKLYASMTSEYEILRTDAPKSIIIGYINACSNMTLPEDNPELFFRQKGYSIEFLGCQYDDDLEVRIDEEIDTYDYIL